ncbi:uncharacterized protein TM35_000451730 [Trypanosoma theileri]|uniref:Uncharacterized protein n=1 Tax=Trypanosoma theileri TaxID=67003 RepID=A0A1X0NI78_9TRYP|nr:uncharacterized protein TM35_000451730 [Trypanosoma theileri]ORC84435.1 hypothetical protein TM35_000451730 [Trypanosoma theileri]
MMSRVLCCLALLLSVVSLCVTAEAVSETLPDDSAGPCPPETTASGEGKTCKTAAGGPLQQPPHLPGAPCPQGEVGTCKNSTSGPEAALPNDCTKSSGTDNCVTNVDNTEGNCGDGSGPSCSSTRRTEQGSPRDPGSPGSTGTIGSTASPVTCPTADGATGTPCPPVSGSSSGEDTDNQPHIKTPAQTPAPAEKQQHAGSIAQQGPLPPSDEPGTEGYDSPGKGAGAGDSVSGASPEGSGVAAPAGDPQSGESGRNENGAANTSSPTNSETEGSSGSSAATVEHERTSAEDETTGTQEGNVGNTDATTTTTTTTLPPEPANNKKGGADSGSSISSSVWVRVPLLIVVTLACILVC